MNARDGCPCRPALAGRRGSPGRCPVESSRARLQARSEWRPDLAGQGGVERAAAGDDAVLDVRRRAMGACGAGGGAGPVAAIGTPGSSSRAQRTHPARLVPYWSGGTRTQHQSFSRPTSSRAAPRGAIVTTSAPRRGRSSTGEGDARTRPPVPAPTRPAARHSAAAAHARTSRCLTRRSRPGCPLARPAPWRSEAVRPASRRGARARGFRCEPTSTARRATRRRPTSARCLASRSRMIGRASSSVNWRGDSAASTLNTVKPRNSRAMPTAPDGRGEDRRVERFVQSSPVDESHVAVLHAVLVFGEVAGQLPRSSSRAARAASAFALRSARGIEAGSAGSMRTSSSTRCRCSGRSNFAALAP